jgi:glyceraldehyde 3-phosphate dehydrogenase
MTAPVAPSLGSHAQDRKIDRVFVDESRSDRYRDAVGVTHDPFVSSDIIRDSRASVIDLGLTKVIDGDPVKVMSWYDNEWGYSSQMVREARRIASDIEGWPA